MAKGPPCPGVVENVDENISFESFNDGLLALRVSLENSLNNPSFDSTTSSIMEELYQVLSQVEGELEVWERWLGGRELRP